MTEHVPKIAVLMATLNGAEFLESQLASIRVQVGVNVTIFARDDGSRDKTRDILVDFGRNNKNMLIMITDGFGPSGSAGLNFLRLATHNGLDGFDYVSFSDQDDIWLPDKLLSAVSSMKANGALCYSSNLLVMTSSRANLHILQKAQPPKKWDYFFQGASAGCTYVFTAKAFNEIRDVLSKLEGKIFSGVSHDWLTYAICRSKGFLWNFDPDAKILYRQHVQNAHGAHLGWKGVVSHFKMLKNGWYRAHILWLTQVVGPSHSNLALIDRLQRYSFSDKIWLALKCLHLRRKTSDCVKVALLMLCCQI